MLAQRGDLANLLEEDQGLVDGITVNSNTCVVVNLVRRLTRCKPAALRTGRVVPAVLETRETLAENLADVATLLLGQVGAVGEDSCGVASASSPMQHSD